ncbi:MAG TPA: response regulator [Thermoguttaceae bacterium]|nr:response regulator [Thermoguttaceae bacterium]
MNDRPIGCPVELLLIEDDPDDVWETQQMLNEAKVTNNLHVATDGEEAMAFLRREGKYTLAPRPDLILLDLNLPKRDGRELLADIQKDSSLAAIPVVVLTTSRAEEDILRARELNCHSYLSKPVRIDHILMLVRSLEEFWVTITRLPGGVEKEKKNDAT